MSLSAAYATDARSIAGIQIMVPIPGLSISIRWVPTVEIDTCPRSGVLCRYCGEAKHLHCADCGVCPGNECPMWCEPADE
jgi:hypothetical protein